MIAKLLYKVFRINGKFIKNDPHGLKRSRFDDIVLNSDQSCPHCNKHIDGFYNWKLKLYNFINRV